MTSTLLIFALIFFSLTSSASTSASLQFKGRVPSIVSLSIVADSISTVLPLSTTQNNTRVARVTEKTNALNGYKVSIESLNKGKLIRTGGSEQFSYNLNYDGVQLNLITGQTITFNSPANGQRVRDVRISYSGVPAENMVMGEYVDNVMFSIAAN